MALHFSTLVLTPAFGKKSFTATKSALHLLKHKHGTAGGRVVLGMNYRTFRKSQEWTSELQFLGLDVGTWPRGVDEIRGEIHS